MKHVRRAGRAARTSLLALVALAAPVIAGAAAPAVAAPVAVDSRPTADAPWLLSVRQGALPQAEAAVRRSGGTVSDRMPALSVLAVRLDVRDLPRVLAHPTVLGAREDSPVRVMADGDRPAPTKNVYRDEIRADDVADSGATGKGVTVALIDTGVAQVPQLASRLVPVTDAAGNTVSCANFTSDPCGDQYGHGTFLAGLITGDGSGPTSGTAFRGMSQARVLDVKIAGAAASASTSTLLAALQWVVAHRDTYSIDVLNLSLGTPSGQSWRVDPLNHAVERAVDAGITTVVSAGNTGPEPQTVTKPGDDPFVITVGAADDRGTPGREDDLIPRFTAQGPTKADGLAKPDLVAPGARLISLRAPGSVVEQNIPGGVDSAYRRGSGTSMAAAVVSGAAAQILSARPELTPAEVKAALVRTATPMNGQSETVTGAGLVDVVAALAYDGPPAPQPAERSAGTGSLQDSSGGLVFSLTEPDPLTGALTADLGLVLDQAAYLADISWTKDGWNAGQFAST
ncbi:MAG: S8 family serine peptidase, partial [Actinomycetota bacterium]|nr:S8 family serine peptidase [Actinomycetota bacterium]